MMTDPAPHQPATYGELFARAMQRNGDRVALSDGTVSLTYRQLWVRMCAVANGLAELGLRPGDGLAQLSRNKIDAIVVIGAAYLAGLRYTPLHPLGSVDDHAYILKDAEIACLVVDEIGYEGHANQVLQATPIAKIVSHGPSRWSDLAEPLAASTAPDFTPRGSAEDIALIAYTGGTTGRPKGVVHRHRSLLANLSIAASEWEWSTPPRFLVVTPVSHAAFLFLLPVFLKGGMAVLRSSFSVEDFSEAVAAHKINMTFIVPTMLYRLLDQAEAVGPKLVSLENLIYGAAPMSPERLAEAIGVFGAKFSQLYGQTEAPNAVTMLFRRDHEPDKPGRLASCGVAIGDSRVQLLNDDGEEVAPGEIGELCVRGPLVMDGYWKREAATTEALKHGWLHTGDMARQDGEGFFHLVDRKKDVIITGGFNVYPREVEDILVQHAGVEACCVVGAPDSKWGEAVTAVIVARKAPLDLEDLSAFARDRLGAAQRPKQYEIVTELPLTGLGKIDRKTVRAGFWSGQDRSIN
ncbi:MAG: AMP-binding protein [Hyphomonadaceae bacterium]|nr:AMP-binding protein [Hyphomonadaceae bacterium]